MCKVISMFALLLGIITCSCSEVESPDRDFQLQGLVLEKSGVINEEKGRKFRDLNQNGKLDVYEDPRESVEKRVKDLLSQMQIEEKAGMMFIEGAPVSSDGEPGGRKDISGPGMFRPTVVESMGTNQLTHFNVWEIPDDPLIFAKWYNQTQQIAEKSRLGIPITIASDPRHHFSNNIFSMSAKGFSQFCETLGFAAIGDEKIMSQFAKIVREEYLAIGIRLALHPQFDLATEPRWARINGGFGEDAPLTARLGKAYILGMQGDTLNQNGIACMAKHFPGGGPQKNGLDPHFDFHQGQIYPGNNFDYHCIPFETAVNAGIASIMPYYGVPMDQTEENVGMAFNKYIITTLLRYKYKFDGIICADWGVITDNPIGPDVVWKARAWGLENLPEDARVLKALEAGCDQFGGESRTDLIVKLVQENRISEDRINQSVRRILRQKFQLGLFDNPFVDESKVLELVGKQESHEFGQKIQEMSLTLLKNENNSLPLLKNKWNIYLENMDSSVVADYARIVSTPEEADFAIIRIQTPWYPVESKIPMARDFHHGDLDFKGDAKKRILDLLRKVPTVVNIYLDRPAVIPEIAHLSKALIADYGASDKALCEVLFGNSRPKGKLPFELPSSMESVKNQLPDLPYDSKDPLFEFGFGLEYE